MRGTPPASAVTACRGAQPPWQPSSAPAASTTAGGPPVATPTPPGCCAPSGCASPPPWAHPRRCAPRGRLEGLLGTSRRVSSCSSARRLRAGHIRGVGRSDSVRLPLRRRARLWPLGWHQLRCIDGRRNGVAGVVPGTAAGLGLSSVTATATAAASAAASHTASGSANSAAGSGPSPHLLRSHGSYPARKAPRVRPGRRPGERHLRPRA